MNKNTRFLFAIVDVHVLRFLTVEFSMANWKRS